MCRVAKGNLTEKRSKRHGEQRTSKPQPQRPAAHHRDDAANERDIVALHRLRHIAHTALPDAQVRGSVNHLQCLII